MNSPLGIARVRRIVGNASEKQETLWLICWKKTCTLTLAVGRSRIQSAPRVCRAVILRDDVMNSTVSTIQTPFNRPYVVGPEYEYIADAIARGHSAGDGYYTEQCTKLLEARSGAHKVLLTTSCTSALELAALLLDIQPGDEVIMPSYTFVSTANAFVLRGAKPVFVDVREDTLNIDETLIEAAITDRTKAIVPVHYAGVSDVRWTPSSTSDAVTTSLSSKMPRRASTPPTRVGGWARWVISGHGHSMRPRTSSAAKVARS